MDFTKMIRMLKNKLFILSTIILIFWLYVFIWHVFLPVWKVKKNNSMIMKGVNKTVVLPYVVVHLDVKGSKLKLSYLTQLLPKLKANGANGLLMEYDDMFPYYGKLANLSAKNCYNKFESPEFADHDTRNLASLIITAKRLPSDLHDHKIRLILGSWFIFLNVLVSFLTVFSLIEERMLSRFLIQAEKLELKIIPLVQTFGHMEHVLKLAEFQHLREDIRYPDSICPSNLGSVTLLTLMIKQVIQLHDTISPLKFIHVGCNEVFHINKCQYCLKSNMSDSDIFLRHVKLLSAIVRSLSADTTVLIWDDMLRGIKPNKWNDIDHFDNVQPVCWDYNPSLEISRKNLMIYCKKFQRVWVASAYKGADGHTAMFPRIRNRFFNLLSWMDLLQTYRIHNSQVDFNGIVLTGRSRFTHMDPPCELLPVSYPSLIINILLVQKYTTGNSTSLSEMKSGKFLCVFDNFVNKYLSKKIIECLLGTNNFDEGKCKFDGQILFKALKEYSAFNRKVFNDTRLGNNELEALEYYSKGNKYINVNQVSKYMKAIIWQEKAVNKFERIITKEMSKYYEDDFVTEYVRFKTYHIRNRLQSMLNSLNSFIKVPTWRRWTINDSSLYI